MENRELGFCFSTSGRSNSATWRTEGGQVGFSFRAPLARVSLCTYLASIHDQDAVCVGHGVDSVGDGEHCAAPECFLDGALDQSVRLRVDGCRGLVQKDNLLSLACKGLITEMEVLQDLTERFQV